MTPTDGAGLGRFRGDDVGAWQQFFDDRGNDRRVNVIAAVIANHRITAIKSVWIGRFDHGDGGRHHIGCFQMAKIAAQNRLAIDQDAKLLQPLQQG